MKNILTALLLSITILSFGQSTMNIHENSGTTIFLPINTVDSFNYVTTPAPARVNIYETGGGIISKLVANIDSTTFTIQSSTELPTLNTLTVVNIASTLATSGGNITNDGGASITARGIVWGSNPNPSLTSNIGQTNDGIGVGIFNSDLTGLTASTTYYVRAYATNSVGTAYGNELSFNSAPMPTLAIGDTFQGGIIFYLDGNGGGLISALSNQSQGAEWGCVTTHIFGGVILDAIGAGEQNTNVILANCNTSGIAADICANLTLGGYSDWFLPSIDELDLMYQNLRVQGLGNFNAGIFWSSSQGPTQNSGTLSTAKHLDFGNGDIYYNLKNTLKYVRAIRAF